MKTYKQINHLSKDSLDKMGFNGYTTKKIFQVERSNENSNINIRIVEKDLEEEYIEEWKPSKASEKYFNEVLTQGYSIGVYHQEELIGFAILAYYEWNNSMWIENIRVSEKHQKKGIGKDLIGRALEISREKSVRILGLETQSTNYPAIQFYKKCGFTISGVDFAKYPQRKNDLEQVAILMTIEIN